MDDLVANEFFKQAVAGGRISKAEYLELTGKAASYTPPEWVTLAAFMDQTGVMYRDIVAWEDANRIEPGSLTAYLNYPAYTMSQIAERLGTTQQRVCRMIAKMRRTFPALRSDVSVKTSANFPDLRHMRHIEASVNSDNNLDSDRVMKF